MEETENEKKERPTDPLIVTYSYQTSPKNHVSVLFVFFENIKRPAYMTKIASPILRLTLPQAEVDDDLEILCRQDLTRPILAKLDRLALV